MTDGIRNLYKPEFVIPDYIPENWHDRIRIVEDDKGVHFLWTGWSNGKGHGKVSIGGKSLYTHRHVVERVDGITLRRFDIVDHLCRYRGCMNREHLEVVTMAENTRRGLGLIHQYKKQEKYTAPVRPEEYGGLYAELAG